MILMGLWSVLNCQTTRCVIYVTISNNVLDYVETANSKYVPNGSNTIIYIILIHFMFVNVIFKNLVKYYRVHI